MVTGNLKSFINNCREGAYLRPSNLRLAVGQLLEDPTRHRRDRLFR